MKRYSPLLSPAPPAPAAGVTLVELLVALVISGLFVPLIWTTIRGSIQFLEATIWQTQLERDLDRLTTLISSEANDACQLGTNAASLPATATAADPTCDTAQRNQLRMRVTLLDANNAPAGTRVVRYFGPAQVNQPRAKWPRHSRQRPARSKQQQQRPAGDARCHELSNTQRRLQHRHG